MIIQYVNHVIQHCHICDTILQLSHNRLHVIFHVAFGGKGYNRWPEHLNRIPGFWHAQFWLRLTRQLLKLLDLSLQYRTMLQMSVGCDVINAHKTNRGTLVLHHTIPKSWWDIKMYGLLMTLPVVYIMVFSNGFQTDRSWSLFSTDNRSVVTMCCNLGLKWSTPNFFFKYLDHLVKKKRLFHNPLTLNTS